MKTIRALFFFLFIASAAAAQSNEREETKRIILGDRNGSNSYPSRNDDRTVYGDRDVYHDRNDRNPSSYNNSKERRAYEINRDYDAKIRSIRWNRNLSRFEKERIIRRLELERRQRLNAVSNNRGRNDRRYHNDDCDDKDNRNNRSNGKRKGWYKS